LNFEFRIHFSKSIPPDREAAQQQLFVGLECWYNQRRRHSALNYQSPVAFEAQFMKNQTHNTSAPVHPFGGSSKHKVEGQNPFQHFPGRTSCRSIRRCISAWPAIDVQTVDG
jgi:hypothetical protein